MDLNQNYKYREVPQNLSCVRSILYTVYDKESVIYNRILKDNLKIYVYKHAHISAHKHT